MHKIRTEYHTMLSGAKALVDAGHIEEAENAFRQLWTISKSHGNDAEREMCVLELVRFLRTRGRSEDAELILAEPEVETKYAAQIKAKQTRDIIVVGASAGGVEPLSVLLSGLPEELNASVFMVQQTPGHSPSVLAKMLSTRSKIPVGIPEDGEMIQTGRAYLAPPNHHLIVKRGSIALGNGPKENRARPAIDVLFRTAAHAYGPRVIGVLLSGVLNDGTAGIMSIKTHGGRSIVQDPEEAVFDAMPRSAITFTKVDHILKAAEIGPSIEALLLEGVSEEGGAEVMPEYEDQADVAEVGGPGINSVAPYPPSAFTCPSCGGAVWQIQEQSLTLFKCHTGHSYTAELLLEEQSEAVDAAAWVLLRSIEENIELRKRLAQWARATGRASEAEFHEQQARDAERQSQAFRALLLSHSKGRD